MSHDRLNSKVLLIKAVWVKQQCLGRFSWCKGCICERSWITPHSTLSSTCESPSVTQTDWSPQTEAWLTDLPSHVRKTHVGIIKLLARAGASRVTRVFGHPHMVVIRHSWRTIAHGMNQLSSYCAALFWWVSLVCVLITAGESSRYSCSSKIKGQADMTRFTLYSI